MKDNILKIENLSVKYKLKDKEILALKNINLCVSKKEILCIVGESGSGKTTLASSILKILPSNASITGKIILDSKDMLLLKEKELNRIRGKDITFIPQDPFSSFNPLLTIGYQFREFVEEKLKTNKKERENLICDSLKQVSIFECKRILGSYPHQLSGGLLQRIFIAMSIVVKPKIIIADEPTSSLDVTTESFILHLFRSVVSSMDASAIFITHNLDVAKTIAWRIGIIYKGELVELQDTREVFCSPYHPYTKQLISSLKRIEDVV